MKDHVFHGPGQSAHALTGVVCARTPLCRRTAFPTSHEVGVPDGHARRGGTVAVDLAESRLEAARRRFPSGRPDERM
ncbi:hypothetical protein [Streptomyces sasae]|uniref:hypothetical protein n=1 Tax=Streptomyces sasae TaxID=1266772 RepID=UPI00293198B1|nr:hypothetical protein [Streptomyces sasae]